MSVKSICAAVLIAGFLASPAIAPANAQDFNAPPSFGTLTLTPGFLPDPVEVDVIAGGPIDASFLGNGCVGNIARPPDVRLHYGAGGRQLYFGVRSEEDTTLIVNTPDGSWYCIDDYRGSLDPFLGGSNPQAGQYDIWIGTFGPEAAIAKLFITEYNRTQ